MRLPTVDDMRAIAVVPTYNEAQNILELIARVHAALPQAHVLVVDDDSPDGTAGLVRDHPAYGDRLHLLARTGERGLGNAYRDGFAWAGAHGYDVVLQLDADLSHPPESLPALVAPLEDADIAIGSRYAPGGRTVGWPWRRRVVSRCAGAYARLVLGLEVRDPTAGFKAYRTRALERIDVGTTTTSGYGFQVECVWRAARAGLRVVEVPIVFTDRVAGSSKMTLGVALEAAARIATWRVPALRSPRRLLVALAVVLTLGLHLLYLDGPLLADEGGFAMVARWWGHGAGLYGPQWVDRPPGLIAVFWVADRLGAHGVRVLATLVAGGFVLAAGWSGWAVRGGRSAVWAAWAGFFLVNSPLTETYALNGELIAATWTMVCVAATVHALRPTTTTRSSAALAALAGAAASAALLTKQDFVDGGVFVLVLGAGLVATGRLRGRRLVRLGAALVAGALVPVLVAVLWAATHTGVEQLVYAMYGFRLDASATMAHWSRTAPDQRLAVLPGLALGSGIATLALATTVAGVQLRRTAPFLLAAAAAALVELVGIVLGGNYWPHYLIGLAPALAFAAGATAVDRHRAGRLVRALVVAPALLTLALGPAAAARVTSPDQVAGAAAWLRRASAPQDSLVVLYSHANLVEASGLRPAYPYAWSLPVRTLDPLLTTLHGVLVDPARAPTWVVGWDDLHAWGLDRDGAVEAALSDDYRRVATVCGRPVWLHDGVARPLPSAAGCR